MSEKQEEKTEALKASERILIGGPEFLSNVHRWGPLRTRVLKGDETPEDKAYLLKLQAPAVKMDKPIIYSLGCSLESCNTPNEEAVIEEALAGGQRKRAEMLSTLVPEDFIGPGNASVWKAVALMQRMGLEYQEGLLYTLTRVRGAHVHERRILLLERRARIMPGPERAQRALERMRRKILCEKCKKSIRAMERSRELSRRRRARKCYPKSCPVDTAQVVVEIGLTATKEMRRKLVQRFQPEHFHAPDYIAIWKGLGRLVKRDAEYSPALFREVLQANQLVVDERVLSTLEGMSGAAAAPPHVFSEDRVEEFVKLMEEQIAREETCPTCAASLWWVISGE